LRVKVKAGKQDVILYFNLNNEIRVTVSPYANANGFNGR
jgi:hypothetical protein